MFPYKELRRRRSIRPIKASAIINNLSFFLSALERGIETDFKRACTCLLLFTIEYFASFVHERM